MDRKINILNGYAPLIGTGLYPDSRDNSRLLEKLGISRLTGVKSIKEVDANPETDLEKALHSKYPGGYNNTSDEYFVARLNGIQYLVLIHCGQWFVGKNGYDEKAGNLVWSENDESDGCRTLIEATIQFKDEKEPCRRTFSVFTAPKEGSNEDAETFFHCETLEEFVALSVSVDNGEDFIVLDYHFL